MLQARGVCATGLILYDLLPKTGKFSNLEQVSTSTVVRSFEKGLKLNEMTRAFDTQFGHRLQLSIDALDPKYGIVDVSKNSRLHQKRYSIMLGRARSRDAKIGTDNVCTF